MALYSSWIHGVTIQKGTPEARMETVSAKVSGFDASLENGLEPTLSNPASAYCAKRATEEAAAVKTYYLAIPTPTMVAGRRTRVVQVFLMYDFDVGAAIETISVFDGPNQLCQKGISRVVNGPGFDGVPDPTHDLEEGVNRFPIPGTPLVFWGLCIVVSVSFKHKATIRFTTAGADFESG